MPISRTLGGDERLLLGLKLDPCAQLIEIGYDAGHVSLVGVTHQHLAGRFLCPGVVHLAGGGDSVQVSRGHLLDYFAAG